MIDPQPLSAKQGEVRFRQALVAHQRGLSLLPDELTGSEIEQVLQQRMKQTLSDIRGLQQQGETITPFLEIGAERCQRSLALVNEAKLSGFAVDLSWDMLSQAPYYQHCFDCSLLPQRICCDALLLPFASHSIPFVFCYQTLHHFAHPWPLLRQIYRVLQPGGLFFMAEEPYHNRLKLNLYSSTPIYSKAHRQSHKLKKALDYFFAEHPCNERAFGVIENDDIPLSDWAHAFAPFVDKHLTLRALNRWAVPFVPGTWLTRLAQWPGGSIQGTVKKPGKPKNESRPLHEWLICPVCLSESRESALVPGAEAYRCTHCQTDYPLLAGILMLLPPVQLQNLYPHLAHHEIP